VPTIVVPVYGRIPLVVRCLEAIDRTVDAAVGVLVVDDCGPQHVTRDDVSRALERSKRPWHLEVNKENLGFVRTANWAFDHLVEDDVVLVNSDAEALPGWWEGIRAAAQAPRVASVSSLTDQGTILSVPELRSLDGSDAAAIRSVVAAAGVHAQVAEVPVAVGHCVYFRRAALDEVGRFDEAFSPGYGEEVDWSLRARRRGWRHVAALDSFVLHEGEGSFASAPRSRRALIRRHEARIAARYPREFVGIRLFACRKRTALAVAKQQITKALVDRSR